MKKYYKNVFVVFGFVAVVGNIIATVCLFLAIQDRKNDLPFKKRLVIIKSHDLERYDDIPSEKSPQKSNILLRQTDCKNGFVSTKAAAVQMAEVALFSELGYESYEKMAEYVTLVDDAVWVVHFEQAVNKGSCVFGGDCYVCIDRNTGKILNVELCK